MSILIRNIEMPKDGCLDVRIYPDGTIFKLSGTRQKPQKNMAIELPPHGRLIDADDEIGVNVTMMPGGKCRVDLIAPTIIPAESGGKM